MKWNAFFLVVVFIVAASGAVTLLGAAEDVSVSCYVGSPEDDEDVGTVDVFDVRTAANSCNVMYNSCGGNCTGCYDDEDSRRVCVDPSGRVYYD
jgi:hypothetical protein